MKIVCAWCKKELGNRPSHNKMNDNEISHGICPECKESLFKAYSQTLDNFLDKFEQPIIAVDSDAVVVAANNSALEHLEKQRFKVKGSFTGNVLECKYAKLPGGCGKTIHCLACTIRRSVIETYKTGKSLKRVPATVYKGDSKSSIERKYIISTEKVNDIVLLKIDEQL